MESPAGPFSCVEALRANGLTDRRFSCKARSILRIANDCSPEPPPGKSVKSALRSASVNDTSGLFDALPSPVRPDPEHRRSSRHGTPARRRTGTRHCAPTLNAPGVFFAIPVANLDTTSGGQGSAPMGEREKTDHPSARQAQDPLPTRRRPCGAVRARKE